MRSDFAQVLLRVGFGFSSRFSLVLLPQQTLSVVEKLHARSTLSFSLPGEKFKGARHRESSGIG